jgi:AbrB family looped-hinge helix DNA binding protein
MKRMTIRISQGGQVSIPADIRRRWGTDRLVLEDRGDDVVIRPLPADPISAARGSLKVEGGLTSEEMRRLAREEDAHIEAMKERRR